MREDDYKSDHQLARKKTCHGADLRTDERGARGLAGRAVRIKSISNVKRRSQGISTGDGVKEERPIKGGGRKLQRDVKSRGFRILCA